MNDCHERNEMNNDDHELLALLDRQEQPSVLLASRFDAQLREQLGVSPMIALFQRVWPSRPAWAFAYSCCLLGSGVFGGQLLSLPADSTPGIQDSGTDRTAQVCPIQTDSALWLPIKTMPILA